MVGAESDALFSVRDKIVLITGATGGIGSVLCRAFVDRGARVIAADRESPPIVPDEVSFQFVDLSNEGTIVTLLERVNETHGCPDVLINNAATSGNGAAIEIRLNQFADIVGVNLTGTFACSQLFGRAMIENRRGKIINLASPCGVFGYPFSVAYNASKAGVWSITQTLSTEWAQYNIQVNAIVPGFIRTPMNHAAMEDPREMKVHRDLIPAGRIGEPDDLVGAALFLSSDASRYMTGSMLIVDGGAIAAGGTTLLLDR